MKRLILLLAITSLSLVLWPSHALSQAEPLSEGDLISAPDSDDPDVYIINEHGFKRLFLNPEIFNFYGHLGGFGNVKKISAEVRDSFVTSGLFRDCESDDQRVFGVVVAGEDVGSLHWVDTPGEQAVTDDPDFFKKVFCINKREFGWYPQGVPFQSVNDVPSYSRREMALEQAPGEPEPAVPAEPGEPGEPAEPAIPPPQTGGGGGGGGDTIAPIVSDVTFVALGAGVTIKWTSDEDGTSVVDYGVESGNYILSVIGSSVASGSMFTHTASIISGPAPSNSKKPITSSLVPLLKFQMKPYSEPDQAISGEL